MQDVARLRIRHHGHVPVPALERGLVHRKTPNRCRLAARKSPRHRALHDSVHRVPAQPHPLGDRLHARHLEPPDHLRLELDRVPRTPLRPGHLDRHQPVLPALDPRDVADQKGLVAPGVQVPPLAAPRIVARARLAAMRTPQRAPPGPLQLHPKFLRLPGRLHPRDLPLPDPGPERRPASSFRPCLRVPFRLVVGQVPGASAPRPDDGISSEPRDPERQPAALLPFSRSTGGFRAQPGRCAWESSGGSHCRVGGTPAASRRDRSVPPSTRSPLHPLRTSPPRPTELRKSASPRPMIQLPMLTTHQDK